MERIDTPATPEESGDLFVPELITSTQYFDQRRRRDGYEPIRALMAAVLEDAIRWALEDNTRALEMESFGPVRRARIAAEAREWLFAGDDRQVFSFVNICDGLNINPENLRVRLKQLRRERRSPWAFPEIP